MSRRHTARAVIAAVVAICCLCAVASAGAAAWLGPTQISGAGVSLSDGTASISLGGNGAAGAGWWEDGGGGRIVLARKPGIGGPFSAPVTVAAAPSAVRVFVGTDGSGDVTAAYTTAGPVWNVANWAAGAVAPTVTPLVVTTPLEITDLEVNGEGDAVIAGLSGSMGANSVVVGYRHLFTGTFAFHTYSNTDIGSAATAARVAINDAGTAVVAFRGGARLLAAVRTAILDWPAAFESVRDTDVVDTVPAVAIDGAGNAVTAYTYKVGAGPAILRTSSRPASGGWVASPDLSSTTTGFTASNPAVTTDPAGASVVAWSEAGPSLANILARAASSAAGSWGASETLAGAADDAPLVAIGRDGTAVAAWEQQGTGGNIGQARVRAPGATGTWSDPHSLDSMHANGAGLSLSSDGQGDFATIDGPFSPALMIKPAVVSSYDAAPPVVVGSATGNLFAGGAVTLSAKATDAWSTVGTPAWTFGDGGSGAGASLPHVYSAPGTYIAHVTVTDSSGNAAGADVTVVVQPAAQATLASARFRAKWKQSRVSGTLLVTGTTPITGTYAFDVSKGKTRKIHVQVKLNAGPYSRSISLPVKLLPGKYHVALVPVSKVIKPATLDIALAAPAEGVVDTAKFARTRAGESVRFHFAALPKTGKLLLTWYHVVSGRRARVASASKTRRATIAATLSLARRHGTFTAVLTRAGKVIAQGTFKVR